MLVVFLNVFGLLQTSLHTSKIRVTERTIVWVQILANSCFSVCVCMLLVGEADVAHFVNAFKLISILQTATVTVLQQRKVVSVFVSVKNVFFRSCWLLLKFDKP